MDTISFNTKKKFQRNYSKIPICHTEQIFNRNPPKSFDAEDGMGTVDNMLLKRHCGNAKRRPSATLPLRNGSNKQHLHNQPARRLDK